jgi:poly-gamma-glutamate system protein
MRPAILRYKTILYLAAVSLIFYLIFFFWLESSGEKLAPDELEAARLMQEAEKEIYSCQQELGLSPEKNPYDPMRTGLIGLESSPLTTTLGQLEAKRTTTNPALAALLVRLLRQVGVEKGQVVAAGASSSFPALIVATYCATRAMGVDLLIIISIGSSQWGANQPEFSWLAMENCLRQAGFDQHRLLAVSWGGEDDSGSEYPEDLKIKLRQEAQTLGLTFLQPAGLKTMVETHFRLFKEAAGGQPIRAFINIGGSLVNLGRDSSILELRPGLTRVKKIPPADRCGLIHRMNIKGLAARYNLPWDPQPLPQPGENLSLKAEDAAGQKTWLLVAVYLLVCAAIIVIFNRPTQRKDD